MDAFDLIQAPDRIRPEVVFDALFLGIGPGLLTLAIFILRHIKRGAGDLATGFGIWLGS